MSCNYVRSFRGNIDATLESKIDISCTTRVLQSIASSCKGDVMVMVTLDAGLALRGNPRSSRGRSRAVTSHAKRQKSRGKQRKEETNVMSLKPLQPTIKRPGGNQQSALADECYLYARRAPALHGTSRPRGSTGARAEVDFWIYKREEQRRRDATCRNWLIRAVSHG
jgi:hypothetical protein